MTDRDERQPGQGTPENEWRRTEGRSPRFHDIETWPIADILAAMLENQSQALHAVWGAQKSLSQAVAAATERLAEGSGRLVYVGAGTSGRLGVLDGMELPPTFGWLQQRLLYVLAGGTDYPSEPSEGAEDDAATALAAVAEARLETADVVLGIAASGTTPFTVRGIEAARAAGALTIGLANNARCPLLQAAEIAVPLETGPEILAGSTRLAAGTAQKVALNLFSTALMIGLNKVHAGHMVEMQATNQKLRQRAQRIVTEITGCTRTAAIEALERADYQIKPAILIVAGATVDQARHWLEQDKGDIAAAKARLNEK